MVTIRNFDFASDRLSTQVIGCSQKLSQQQIQYKVTIVYNWKRGIIISAGLCRAVLSDIERCLGIHSISVNSDSIANRGLNLWAAEEEVSTTTNTEC
jgi:hypothetical protein